MKFGVALGALNPHFHLDATLAAEELGYESVWLPEHLVFTRAMIALAAPGRGAPAGAARHADLRRVRVPRVPRGRAPNACGSARTCSTSGCATRSRRRAACRRVDICCRTAASSSASARRGSKRSGTRPQLDFATRGRRVDEAIEVCKRLLTEETITHHGEFFSFDEVVFEPKPRAAAVAADPRRRRVEGGAAPRGPARRRLDRHGAHVRVGARRRSTTLRAPARRVRPRDARAVPDRARRSGRVRRRRARAGKTSA